MDIDERQQANLGAMAAHAILRRALVAELGKAEAPVLAVALMYEVASIVASLAASQPEARAMLVDLFEVAAGQIKHLGVGRAHP